MKNYKKNKQKLVSIIIRTYNEEEWIESCLDAIDYQTYKNIEIIIVDNFSKDSTIKKLKNRNIKIVKIKKFLPGKALNLGIKASKGFYIVCLSAHCIPKDKKWLDSLISPLTKNTKVVAVYGRQEPYAYSSALDKRDLLTTFGLDKIIQKKDPFFHNANSAFSRNTWKKFPFDEKVANVEDRLWGKTLIDNKLQIQYEPKASVYHWHGINHSQDKSRAESIIRILENQNNFFSYQIPKSKSNKNKGIAIIPIRGKDTKNYKNLDQTLNLIKDNQNIQNIIVSTDDKKIQSHAIKKGFKAILRPKILSNKFTDIFDVAKYSINLDIKKIKNINFVAIFQIDYPNRDRKLIDKMISLYKEKNHNFLVAAKIENRAYEILNSKKLRKNINYQYLLPKGLKEDKLVILLTGLCTIININDLLNDSWRYKNINYFEVSDINSIKSEL